MIMAWEVENDDITLYFPVMVELWVEKREIEDWAEWILESYNVKLWLEKIWSELINHIW